VARKRQRRMLRRKLACLMVVVMTASGPYMPLCLLATSTHVPGQENSVYCYSCQPPRWIFCGFKVSEVVTGEANERPQWRYAKQCRSCCTDAAQRLATAWTVGEVSVEATQARMFPMVPGPWRVHVLLQTLFGWEGAFRLWQDIPAAHLDHPDVRWEREEAPS